MLASQFGVQLMLIVEGGTKLKPSKTTCYVGVIISQVVGYYIALKCFNVIRSI